MNRRSHLQLLRAGVADQSLFVNHTRAHEEAESGRSSFVRPDPHQLLAEIGPLEKPHEGFGRGLQALGDKLLVLDLALADPAGYVAQEVAMAGGEVGDDEAAEG